MWPIKFMFNWMPCGGRCSKILHIACTDCQAIFIYS
jgi:hypothetical protein